MRSPVDDTVVEGLQIPPEWDQLLDVLPGGVLLRQGFEDLKAGRETVGSLLIQIGRPRLHGMGVRVAEGGTNPEHRLYDLLASSDQDSAHSRYNALLNTLASFFRAAECVAK